MSCVGFITVVPRAAEVLLYICGCYISNGDFLSISVVFDCVSS